MPSVAANFVGNVIANAPPGSVVSTTTCIGYQPNEAAISVHVQLPTSGVNVPLPDDIIEFRAHTQTR